MSVPPLHDPSTGSLLHTYGWNPQIAALLGDASTTGLEVGRIIADDRGIVTAITATETTRLDRRGFDVTTGDWVLLTATDPPSLARVLPRWSQVRRHDAGRTSVAQTLAANIDVCLLTVALDRPDNPRRLDRLLTVAWDSGATPLVVATKSDAATIDVEAIEARTSPVGVETIVTSATTGDGLAALREHLPPQTTAVLVGESGAGKSSLINALAGTTLSTQAVRTGDAKGRHTTTRRQLVPIPGGGVVMDTPGIRGVGLAGEAGDGLTRTFGDIAALAGSCRFRDCAHGSEPGCAVRAAVGDGSMAAERLDAYLDLQREQDAAALRADVRRSRAAQRTRGREFKRTLDDIRRHQGRER